jgi:UDP-N-acetylmuramyl pentapeptide phosphotransferase/UDP-N-acetylglucosamine-1-phosphate transferase
MAMGPLFIAGFLEDLGFDISPMRRLLTSLFSAGLAVYFLDIWLDSIDVPVIDTVFVYAPVGIAFSIFISATISNGFNLIDGLHGLAGGLSVLAALGLAFIARNAGAPEIEYAAFAMAAAVAGFLLLNFPSGRIFLGDAGAYCIGFLLCWFAFILASKDTYLTPWSFVLVFYWPIADTFLAIYRRRSTGRATDLPDRLHFHQLVMRALEISWLGRGQRQISNPLATLIILPFAAIPVFAGVVFWDHTKMAVLVTFVFTALFVTSYRLGVRKFSKPSSRRTVKKPSHPKVASLRKSILE